jgi:hypothetical protein
MKKQLIVLLMISSIMISGCTTMMTKEFIPIMPSNESGEEVIEFYNWELEAPKLIAYKGTAKIEEVRDPNLFWTTLYVRTPFIKGLYLDEDVIIDSIYFEFFSSDSQIVRTPSRVAKYVDNGENYNYKVFNFFGDSGIVIPPTNSDVTLSFTAKIVNSNEEVIHTKEFSIELFLNETETSIPFMTPR